MSRVSTRSSPRARAFPRMLASRYPVTIAGKRVRISACHMTALLQHLRRADDEHPRANVHLRNELVDEGNHQLLGALALDDQVRDRAGVPDLRDSPPRRAVGRARLEAHQ